MLTRFIGLAIAIVAAVLLQAQADPGRPFSAAAQTAVTGLLDLNGKQVDPFAMAAASRWC